MSASVRLAAGGTFAAAVAWSYRALLETSGSLADGARYALVALELVVAAVALRAAIEDDRPRALAWAFGFCALLQLPNAGAALQSGAGADALSRLALALEIVGFATLAAGAAAWTRGRRAGGLAAMRVGAVALAATALAWTFAGSVGFSRWTPYQAIVFPAFVALALGLPRDAAAPAAREAPAEA